MPNQVLLSSYEAERSLEEFLSAKAPMKIQVLIQKCHTTEKVIVLHLNAVNPTPITKDSICYLTSGSENISC